MRKQLHRFVHYVWTRITIFHIVLYPLSLCFFIVSSIRKFLLSFLQIRLRVPFIVVGNVTVGGNGKTTFVIALVQHLQRAGYRVGVVSRGYRRRDKRATIVVNRQMDPAQVGDEVRLIWDKTQALICASPNRISACQLLIDAGCNIIVSDDGMQNYRLHRDIEVSLISSSTGFGNGLLLPAGPLREYPQRARRSDFCIFQEQTVQNDDLRLVMSYKIEKIINLFDKTSYTPDSWPFPKHVHAACAIGNPAGFFELLSHSGFSIKSSTLPDHDTIQLMDFSLESAVFITEKDAVKIKSRSKEYSNIWVVSISPIFNFPIFEAMDDELSTFSSQVHT